MAYTNVNNGSSLTINDGLVIPEVYSQIVRDKIPGAMRVGQFMTKKGDLFNTPGETINFLTWAYIGDASAWDANTAMSVTAMQQKEKPASVYAIAAPGVKVKDIDDAVEYGNALEEAASQQAISIARKVDADAIDLCLGSPLKKTLAGANAITQDELIAAFGLYGDDVDYAQFDGIVINSAMAPSFYAMPLFINNTMTTATDDNGIVVNGQIGKFLNIPVILSDRCYDSTNQESFALIIKKDSLAYVPKENPFSEAERVPSKRETILYTSQFLAMCLVNEAGVVVCKKTV